MQKIFTIIIKGDSQSDIDDALAEVSRLIQEGNTSAINQNSSSSFQFISAGEYLEEDN